MNIKKKQRGFTLIEIIIAFALFAIMMGGIYGIVLSAMNNNKAGEVKQQAALYGQEVFEEFKCGDITKTETNSIMLSNNIVLQPVGESNYEGEGYLDKDNKYYAKITVKKNDSITLDKDIKAGDGSGKEEPKEKTIKTCDFNIALSGESSPIKVKEGKSNIGNLEYNTEVNENLKLIINTKTKDDEKVVVIKDKNNKEILTAKSGIEKDNDKDNSIRLNFNFEEYKVKSKVDDKYKKVEINVFNQDDIGLNIVLKKSEKVDVEVNNKLGKVRVYDNRVENDESVKLGQLYDITVEIKKNKEDASIFAGHSSQNINIK
ncbi:hypothetical protein UT300005_15910 [Clostridium sp. CTA-5]